MSSINSSINTQKVLLAQAMALLMSTTPDTTLGKLLNFCLAAKVESDIAGKSPRAFAEELLNEPVKLSAWIQAVVDSDDDYSVDEMLAISEIHLKDSQQFSDRFMAKLWEEVTALVVKGILTAEE
ncbi:MAG: hypothetical protein AAFN18_07540 [Cyanobacteria bacterium J06554_6]